MKFNTCKLELEFEFGDCRGDYFRVQINNGDSVKDVDYFNPFYSTMIELPATLKITTSGKNHKIHTIVKDGEIVEDMYVKVNKLKLDGLAIGNTFYHKKLTLTTIDNQEHTTNYFGFNGTCTIDFVHSNVFTQFLSLNTDTDFLEKQRAAALENSEVGDGSVFHSREEQDHRDPWNDLAQ